MMLSWNVALNAIEVKDVPGSVGCVMSGGHTAVGATLSLMIPNEHVALLLLLSRATQNTVVRPETKTEFDGGVQETFVTRKGWLEESEGESGCL